jgi:hypothetical protein
MAMYGDYTYKDQSFTEIYDGYDLQHEPLPEVIGKATVTREQNNTRYVYINYQSDGIWNLDGIVGKASWYEEAGKKAFVRGGQYKHPTKGWTSEIVYMTAYDYIEACAKMFSARVFSGNEKPVTAEKLIKMRLKDYDLEEVFSSAQGQIFYPVIDYKDKAQEGLHRAIWFMMSYDANEEIPVIVIR